MLKIKQGANRARVGGLGPEILIAVIVASEVYSSFGYDFVITSGTDGVHGWSSEHYKGDAVDGRTSMIQPEARKSVIAAQIKDALGSDYDVVLESDHIHIEFDPK